MSSKLKKAIGAVKDQTSIGLARVSNNNSANLEVAVLKATTHDEVPIEDRYMNDVLLLTSSSKLNAAACAQAIAKRIGRTRSWIVVLKSLILVLRLFQDGDPHFPKEVLHAMKRGAKILNLSSFRDDSNSNPWDYTAFVHTFAIYLDERLDCFLMGKLQRRVTHRTQRGRRVNEPVRDIKPPVLLDRMSYWQRLLERAIATQPTGAAKSNRLVQIALYHVVQESFDLYRDVSDGLALLLDSFFHLQYQSCINAFQTCVKASKQFGELCSFYTLCKNMGVGRTSEYPSVQKISDELIETLQEFLKDQASFASVSGRSQRAQLFLPAPPSSEPREASEQSESISSEMRSERGTSLEDILSMTDAGTSPSSSIDREQRLQDQFEKRSQQDDMMSVNEPGTSPNLSPLDLLSFDDEARPQQEQQQPPSVSGSAEGTRECWELVLAETASNISSTQVSNNMVGGFDSSFLGNSFDESSQQHHHNNPFLQDTLVPAIVPAADPFSSVPTFPAAPTFRAQNPSEKTTSLQSREDDPFAPGPPQMGPDQILNGVINQQHVLHEQQLWLHNQNKIIARRLSS